MGETDKYKYCLIRSILTRKQFLQPLTDQEHYDLFEEYDDKEIPELEQLDSELEIECLHKAQATKASINQI